MSSKALKNNAVEGGPKDPQSALSDLCTAALQANWSYAMFLLKEFPSLINAARDDASATFTCLHHAARQGRLAAIVELLAMGADPGLRNWKGELPVDIARRSAMDVARRGNTERVQEFNDVVEALRPPVFTLSQLLRREVDASGYSFLADGEGDRQRFWGMCAVLSDVRCPKDPSAVAQRLVAAYHSLSGAAADATVSVPPVWARFFRGLSFASRSFSARIAPSRRVVADVLTTAALRGSSQTLLKLAAALSSEAFMGIDSVRLVLARALDAEKDRLAAIAQDSSESVPAAVDVEFETLDQLLTNYSEETAKWDAMPPAFKSTPLAVTSGPAFHPAYRPPARLSSVPNPRPDPFVEAAPRAVSWISIGDWGETYCTPELAKRVANFVKDGNDIDFLLFLGDNFYPNGVTSIDDKRFKEQWADAFLAHKELHVPHKMVIGNHDRNHGNGKHQVDFAADVRNYHGLWQYHGDEDRALYTPSRCYTFKLESALPSVEAPATAADASTAEGDAVSPPPTPEGTLPVNFVVMDTCAAQWNCLRHNPDIKNEFERETRWLQEQLRGIERSQPKHHWTFLCGHHGMYTNGRGHGAEGQCLRSLVYGVRKNTAGPDDAIVNYADGLGLEHTLATALDENPVPVKEAIEAARTALTAPRGRSNSTKQPKITAVDAYFCGHDHVMQTARQRGMDHLCFGSSIECGYYGGRNTAPEVPVDWFDDRSRGFGYCTVTPDSDGKGSTFRTLFVNLATLKPVYELVRHKNAAGEISIVKSAAVGPAPTLAKPPAPRAPPAPLKK